MNNIKLNQKNIENILNNKNIHNKNIDDIDKVINIASIMLLKNDSNKTLKELINKLLKDSYMILGFCECKAMENITNRNNFKVL